MTLWPDMKVGRAARLISGVGFPHHFQGRTSGAHPFLKVSDLSSVASGQRLVTAQNWVDQGDLVALGARLAPQGAIVFPKVGAALLKNPRRLLGVPAAMDNNLMAVVPLLGEPRFWLYALSTVDLGEIAAGGALPYVNEGQVRDLRIPFPDPEEQRRIADFLDTESRRIGKVLRRTEAQADLLRVRRRAFIDAHLAERDGDHRMVPLRYLLRPSFVSERPDLQVLSVYRDYGVIPKNSRQDNFNKTPEDVSRYLVVHPGDLVVNKMKAWQGSLGVSRHHGIVSPDYLVAKVTSDAYDSSYLHYLLRSPRLVGEYAVRSRGIRPSQWRLYWEDLAAIRVPAIPKAEQEAKVRELEREDAWVEKSLEAMQLRTRLLVERRQALIAAAVTGQFDVTTAGGRDVTEGVSA
ncbi:restriction endonuclease subunit S [Streptomyces sp. NPDC038707]|uniref:restriction endonuclease subunit S n=1 Tax=unclassified Streptomyces TaxID=2593676 RepID=UPI0033E4F6F7